MRPWDEPPTPPVLDRLAALASRTSLIAAIALLAFAGGLITGASITLEAEYAAGATAP